MIDAEHDRFIPALPQKYRAQSYAAIALVLLIVYTVQLMVGIAEFSRIQELREQPFPGFRVQNTSLAYRN